TLGETATFSVSSSGTAPLAYQWIFNSTSIPGATASSYTLTNAQLTDAGAYFVTITNLAGTTVGSNATLTVNVPAPSTWLDQDIGAVSIPGYLGYTNGTFTVNASGSDIWGNADEFHFVYQPLNGDGAIVAHVLNVQVTDGWAKAGVMIRET